MENLKSPRISKEQISGLYAITPDESNTAELLRKVRLALRGGARVLQYRNKTAKAELKLHQAQTLRDLCSEFNVTYLVNDDAQLALQVQADGVHLGGDDGSISKARSILGEKKIIGMSCYNDVLLAHEADRQGADYVAFGTFFLSNTKPGAKKAEIKLLSEARAELDLPIVVIGGITQVNGATLINAGADSLAVISALWNAPNIQSSAQEFSTLFSRN
jgi:thiamine-phosphate pyrophosphorylase